MTDFDGFSKSLGFDTYPFSVFTAEEEKDLLSDSFVKPMAFSPAAQAAKAGTNIFLYGERGTGKTALLYRLMLECGPAATIIEVSDFSSVPTAPVQADVYKFYVSSLATAIFAWMLAKKGIFGSPFNLDRDERLLLSYLLKEHTTPLSRQTLQEEIKKIQHGRVKRSLVWLFNAGRGVLNRTIGVGVDAVSDFISKSFNLPGLGEATSGPKDYLHRLELAVDDKFDAAKANLALLKKTLALCQKIQMGRVVLVFDRIDEDSRLKNDAGLVADFVRPFLTENEVFYQKDLQFIFSLWSMSYQKVKPDFRANKFCVESVSWKPKDLLEVLGKRIQVHSALKLRGYKDLLLKDDLEYFYDRVLPLANVNPRDFWQLMNRIVREQFSEDDSSAVMSRSAMEKGVREFVEKFSYYEYYPRKRDAKANTMDVYSHIAHLSKLSSPKFTNSGLSDAAGTGSSTTNYITGMEAMGLIRRCEEKGPNGATLYEIRDPKVTYAVENKIDIRRDA
jgi:hypothetical protein